MKYYFYGKVKNMRIEAVCPYSFGANTYLILSEGHALVVDPACSVDAILGAVAKNDAALEGILLTHGHFDHTVSIDTLRRATAVPAHIHERDAIMLTDGKKNAYYSFYGKECVHAPAEILLKDGDKIKLGDEQIEVIHTPGHSGGSVCFHCGDFLVTGDTLFAESIGRCDLWGGSEYEIVASLNKLRSLPRALKIFAGHGGTSTLGDALDNAAYYL